MGSPEKPIIPTNPVCLIKYVVQIDLHLEFVGRVVQCSIDEFVTRESRDIIRILDDRAEALGNEVGTQPKAYTGQRTIIDHVLGP
ncbi:MAG: hypothetical protein ACI81P_003491 [Neolewinella sp.]